jgi:hypothetical protein
MVDGAGVVFLIFLAKNTVALGGFSNLARFWKYLLGFNNIQYGEKSKMVDFEFSPVTSSDSVGNFVKL